jgi:hypothetical protein
LKKLDLKKELKPLYEPSAKEVVEVGVPMLNYLMVDGEGDPNTSEVYSEAVEALFSVAYGVKFLSKKSLAIDYGVMPLEGLWWAEDMSKFSVDDKADWKWTMMILQPSFITSAIIDQVMADLARKKNLAALTRLRFEAWSEGKCAQILHVGPFTEEGPTVEKLHEYIDGRGMRTGKHHEIYLSDIRKADPARWRTIIRQPMAYR